MVQIQTIIEGTIQPDGSLVLDGPTKLPAGRVQVIVRPLPCLVDGHPFWDLMQSIWATQKDRELRLRSREEIDAECKAIRDSWDERQRQIELLQQEARELRERHGC